MKFEYDLNHYGPCDGKAVIDIKGDLNGNSQLTAIKFTGDQFKFTDFTKYDDGFKLEILGTWELETFLNVLNTLHSTLLKTKENHHGV